MFFSLSPTLSPLGRGEGASNVNLNTAARNPA